MASSGNILEDQDNHSRDSGVSVIVPFLEREEGESGRKYNEEIAPRNAMAVEEIVSQGDVEEAIFIDGSNSNSEFSSLIEGIAAESENVRYLNESDEELREEFIESVGTDPVLMPDGKGSALYKASALANQDNIIAVDSDVTTTVNENVDESIETYVNQLGEKIRGKNRFVKGNIDRIQDYSYGEDSGKMYGGRVTRATKPLLKMFSDEVEGIDSFEYPLSGEFAIERDLMLDLDTWSGFGLEIGMLVQVAEEIPESDMADIDLGYHSHISHDDGTADQIAEDVFGAFKEGLRRYKDIDPVQMLEDDANVDGLSDNILPYLREVYENEIDDGKVSPGVYWTPERIATTFLYSGGSTEPIGLKNDHEIKVN